MKNISYEIFNDLERVCEQLASLIDPCQTCDCQLNSFECEFCNRSKNILTKNKKLKNPFQKKLRKSIEN